MHNCEVNATPNFRHFVSSRLKRSCTRASETTDIPKLGRVFYTNEYCRPVNVPVAFLVVPHHCLLVHGKRIPLQGNTSLSHANTLVQALSHQLHAPGQHARSKQVIQRLSAPAIQCEDTHPSVPSGVVAVPGTASKRHRYQACGLTPSALLT